MGLKVGRQAVLREGLGLLVGFLDVKRGRGRSNLPEMTAQLSSMMVQLWPFVPFQVMSGET